MTSIFSFFKSYQFLHLAAFPLLIVLLLFTILLGLSSGASSIPLFKLLSNDLTSLQQYTLFEIRFPRVFMAAVIGAALALSGAALQGLFRNPLADPGLIGISSGAALSVAFTIVFLEPLYMSVLSSIPSGIAEYISLFGLSFMAFLGGLLSCLLIFSFAKLSRAFSVTYLLLAGIAINAITGAFTGFFTFLSTDEQLRALSFWTMGNLNTASWSSFYLSCLFFFPCAILLFLRSKELNIMLLGEDEALHLGVDAKRLQMQIVLLTALTIGSAVALCGIIGFVGLVVPHLIRLTLGPDHRTLFPAAALLGASLLVFSDSLSRTLLAPAEVPVGILTSLIGGPFFLWLLLKQYSGRFAL